jgi:Family of unknown function (DUF6230)
LSGNSALGGYGKVRWRRFALMLTPAVAVAAVLMVLTAQSVLAVSFAISGVPFVVTADELHGQGFEQFGVLDHSIVNQLPGHTNQTVLAANAIRSAQLTNLCQSVQILGVSLRITAGAGGSPVRATDLVVDADRLSGSVASFTHITIGQDASTLRQVPGVTGPRGGFSLAAQTISISHLRQHAYATTAGTFTLPGFRLSFGRPC